jgi:hypothetical protein
MATFVLWKELHIYVFENTISARRKNNNFNYIFRWTSKGKRPSLTFGILRKTKTKIQLIE